MRSLASAASVVLFSMLLLPPLAAGPAVASDGVLEISQTCAVHTGCFSGDTAGWPVTIATPGSYRLTSNLILPDSNTTGIYITTNDVGIDLNQFSIIGVACVGATDSSCRPASVGSGVGINVDNFFIRRGISVRNGSITGMGEAGVHLGAQSEMVGLRTRWNAGHGIYTYDMSRISDNLSYENGFMGIVAGNYATVSGNTALSNGTNGISTYNGSTISGNTVSFNGGHGLYIGTNCLVEGNTSSDNTGWGLSASPNTGYHGNVISNNTAGSVIGGVNAGANICNGVLCP